MLRVGEILDQSLVARRIGEFHMILVATPAYLRRHGTPRHPRELEERNHRVVNYFAHGSARSQPLEFIQQGETLELTPRHAMAVNDASAGLAACLAGLGIVRTATFMAQPHIASGDLVPLLLEWCAQPMPIHVVYPPNRHLSAKVRVFVDWVADLFAQCDTVRRDCSLPLTPDEEACATGATGAISATSAPSARQHEVPA